MKKLLTILTLTLFLSLTFVSAMQVQFFYSETCSHCQSIYPFVMEKTNQYPTYIFGIYNLNDEDNYNKYLTYNFEGVPAFVINTNDNREISFTGANARKLHCELQEMTTKNCPTYSSDNCIGGSWFKD